VNPKGTIADLKKLTVEQAATVYQREYWDAVMGSVLPAGVDYAVFDFAVNSGPKRAAMFLQRVVGVTQDGVIGPVTLKAVGEHGSAAIIEALCDARLAWLKTLKGASGWDTFGKGWASRVEAVRKLAREMALGKPTGAPKPSAAPTPEPETPATDHGSEPEEGPKYQGIDFGKVGIAIAIVALVAGAALAFLF
jgi:lysozyme family protein